MHKELVIKSEPVFEVPAIMQPAISRPDYSGAPQTGSVLDYWRILKRCKVAVVAFAALGLAAGLGVTFLQTPMYRATAALEIQDNKDNFLASKMLQQANESNSADALTDVQTQMRILQSKTLIDRAVKKLEADSFNGKKDVLSLAAPAIRFLPGSHAAAKPQELVDKLSKQLKVTQSGQTRVVELAFEASNPVEAARFTNALTSEFIQANVESRLDLSRRTTDLLVGQLDDLRSKLRHSENTLQAYARQQGLIFTNQNQSISEQKLEQLQSELSKAQAERVEKQSRAEVAHTVAAEAVPDVLNDGNLRAMESTLTDLRRQEADLKVVFTPDYSKTKRMHAEIETLEAAIATKRAEIISRVDHELTGSKKREQLLSAAYARQMRFVADDSEKSIQYDMLKHEVDTNREIYQTMLQRVKESSIASAMKATNVRVLDPANTPEHPYKPNLPINGGAGVICGLMLGLVGSIARARNNATVQEPGDAGLLLGIPELGVIPAAEAARKHLTPVQTMFAANRQIEAPETASTNPENSSLIADSFRSVLASILLAGLKRRQQVLVVTSANAGEGKTTTVTNLGATLANMNRKVLLIDGDIRSPRLHHIFNLDNKIGLTSVLQQMSGRQADLQGPIHHTSNPNLHVLTSGPAVEAGADLLFSSSIPALIARYREQYDMVLIDTPPMLTMPDARFLGRVADGVVLIARSGRTGREAIQAACRRFLEDHTPIVGVVLNDWNAKFSNYQYYSHYKDSAAGQPGNLVNVLGG
jgi:succinoglycan biosynthesis transport protein ExoP